MTQVKARFRNASFGEALKLVGHTKDNRKYNGGRFKPIKPLWETYENPRFDQWKSAKKENPVTLPKLKFLENKDP